MAVKQNNNWIVITFAVNFCLTLTTLYLVGIMFWVGLYKFNPVGQASSSQSEALCAQNQDQAGAVKATVNQIKIRELASDTGFSPKSETYVASDNSDTVLTVENMGFREHSFVIDEVNLDTGLIAPGSSKDINLGNFPFDLGKTYTFYSNAAGDNKDDFSGVLTVRP